jgi:hypothetical protein
MNVPRLAGDTPSRNDSNPKVAVKNTLWCDLSTFGEGYLDSLAVSDAFNGATCLLAYHFIMQ